ncbi:uncharacterized protein [Setaria viridis]|uniref:uncharacterized protein isoform X2 n=1 Tax=Setaria viridis TaxID=4556 RepID=UPI003B3A8ACA
MGSCSCIDCSSRWWLLHAACTPLPYPSIQDREKLWLILKLSWERGVCMDRRPERKAKRAREEDADAAPDFPFEEAAAAALGADDDAGEASRRPPGVFRFPWQKCRGGLGVSPGAGAGGAGWELRDVFFRSLVDGGAAAIGVPGDRLVSPPRSKRALLDGVDAWLAAAADGEVDPVWRSALMSRRGPASSAA